MSEQERRNLNFFELPPKVKVQKIMDRIASADPKYSGILVFTTGERGLQSAFANTVLNQYELERDYVELGVYNRTHNPTTLERVLRLAAGLGNKYD